MYCEFCGAQNPDNSSFCTGCGNNLQQTAYLDGTSHEPIKYERVEFEVTQKLLALRATYKIKDVNKHEFMVAKKKFINPFRPYFYIETPDGQTLGHIQGNFWRTKYNLIDAQGNLHATVIFPFLMFFRKRFEIETPHGLYRSGESFFAYKFETYAPDGQISFLVDKKILSIRDNFKIQSFGGLSPFITCLAAVCIDRKFHTGDKSPMDFD